MEARRLMEPAGDREKKGLEARAGTSGDQEVQGAGPVADQTGGQYAQIPPSGGSDAEESPLAGDPGSDEGSLLPGGSRTGEECPPPGGSGEDKEKPAGFGTKEASPTSSGEVVRPLAGSRSA